MNTDLHDTLRVAFGEVLLRHRRERNLTTDALAVATDLFIGSELITGFERGEYEPTLTDFFRIALALRLDPVLLFVDLVTAWRTNPADYGLVKSRPSDLVRLYRLGYSIDPGDFRELPAVYGTEELALHAATGLNVTRVARGQPRVDALLTYVRLAWSGIPRLRGADSQRQPDGRLTGLNDRRYSPCTVTVGTAAIRSVVQNNASYHINRTKQHTVPAQLA
jgi:transcriptional regulator with XRE-family HTH domain